MNIRNCTSQVVKYIDINGNVICYKPNINWVIKILVTHPYHTLQEPSHKKIWVLDFNKLKIPDEIDEFLKESNSNYIIVSELIADTIKIHRPELVDKLIMSKNINA